MANKILSTKRNGKLQPWKIDLTVCIHYLLIFLFDENLTTKLFADYIYHQSYYSFKKFCLEDDQLPVDYHVTLSDIIAGACHLDSFLPYFIRHAKQAFPHLQCLDDLKKVTHLRLPANW
jgi:hypothetical protein